MPVVISDETLKQAGLTELEAVVEIACRLFDAGKLAALAGRQASGDGPIRVQAELGRRKIAVYRPSEQDLAEDLAALDRLGI